MKFNTMTKIALAAALAFTVVGCGSKDKPAGQKADAESKPAAPRTFKAEDFADKTFAILSGSSFDAVARENIGAKLHKYYDTPVKSIEAIMNGEADATLIEEPVGRKFAAQNDKLIALYPPVDIENYATIFPKKDNGKLRDEYNAFLVKIRSDGVYEDMVRRWVDSPTSPPMPEIALNPVKGKKKLLFLTSDCDEPFSYKAESGNIEGFDIELTQRFAQANGYDLEVKVVEFPDMIPTIQAGGADLASNLITITDERKAFVDFSEPVYYGGTVVLTRK